MRRNLWILAAVLMPIIAACEYSEIDGIGTRTADVNFPPQSDLVSFDGCEPGNVGQWRFDATIRNNTPTVASYELTVAFYDGDARVDEASNWVRDLKPGESASAGAGRWIDSGGSSITRCQVLTINRWS